MYIDHRLIWYVRPAAKHRCIRSDLTDPAERQEWVTSEWCTFDNQDGYSTFVIRKPGTNAQNAKRAYVPNTGVE